MGLRTASLGDSDLHHHPRRTPDQYFYRSINTKLRDSDQIISYPTGKVLMVDQLWIYVTSSDTIVTFFPENKKGGDQDKEYAFADLRTKLANGLKDMEHRDGFYCGDAFDMTAYCLYHAVTVLLGQHDVSDECLAVMRVFRDTLEETYDNAVRAFDKFIRSPNDHLQVDKDLAIFQKSVDLSDELRILKHLFAEQRKVVVKFLTQVKDIPEDKPYAVHLAKRAIKKLDEYTTEVKKFQNEAFTTQDYITNLMDLKQKGAGLNVARSSAEQGRIMMIFTVFTIVFLPLSFFAAIYGMNIKEWSSVNSNPGAQTVLMYMAPISTVVIFLALLIAFFGRLKDLASKGLELLRGKRGKEDGSFQWRQRSARDLDGVRSMAQLVFIARHGGDSEA